MRSLIWRGLLIGLRFDQDSTFEYDEHGNVTRRVRGNQASGYLCNQISAPKELTDAQGNIVWAVDDKVRGEARLRATDWPRTGADVGLIVPESDSGGCACWP